MIAADLSTYQNTNDLIDSCLLWIMLLQYCELSHATHSLPGRWAAVWDYESLPALEHLSDRWDYWEGLRLDYFTWLLFDNTFAFWTALCQASFPWLIFSASLLLSPQWEQWWVRGAWLREDRTLQLNLTTAAQYRLSYSLSSLASIDQRLPYCLLTHRPVSARVLLAQL